MVCLVLQRQDETTRGCDREEHVIEESVAGKRSHQPPSVPLVEGFAGVDQMYASVHPKEKPKEKENTRSSERMREGKELSPLPCRNSQDCSHTKVDPAFFMKEEEEEEELDIL